MPKGIIKTGCDYLYLAGLLALPLWLTGHFESTADLSLRLFLAITFAVLVGIVGGLPSHWRNPMHEGRPTAWYRSRRRPPWDVPREVSSGGSRTDRADYRLLERRLAKIKDLPEAPGGDWERPSLLHDPATGQYWRRELREAGFNQWHVLIPVASPDATARGAPTRSD